MNTILIIILAIVISIAFLWFKKQNQTKTTEKIDYKDAYQRKQTLLTKSELKFYKILKTALPENEIFANVRMVDLIKVNPKHRGFENKKRFHLISQNHIDFVICDKETNIMAVIELDDKTHDTPDRQKADLKKDECLAAVGIKFIRIHVEKMPEGEEIRKLING